MSDMFISPSTCVLLAEMTLAAGLSRTQLTLSSVLCMQTLHLLVVTNKSSNILEDLDILRILAKIVPDYAQSLDEEGITKAAFDLLFAFDEVISLGHKENVTLQQVRQNTEMESHEEKLYKMIIQSKRQEAIQNMRQKAQEIDRAKMESAKAGRGMPSSYTPSPGMGSRSLDQDNTPTYMSQAAPTAFSSSRPTEAGRPAKKGMQLGKAKKANDFLDSLRAEVRLVCCCCYNVIVAMHLLLHGLQTRAAAPDRVRPSMRISTFQCIGQLICVAKTSINNLFWSLVLAKVISYPRAVVGIYHMMQVPLPVVHKAGNVWSQTSSAHVLNICRAR